MAGNAQQEESTGITIQQLEQLLRSLPKSQIRHNSSDDEMDNNFAGFAGMVSCSTHKGNEKWIIDSGTSDHMTCNSECVENTKVVKNKMKITLPNGECSTITHCGTVKLRNGLILENVLVVPDFKHNLLSVNKLTSLGHCKVNFYAGYCIIVEDNTLKIRGVGECRNGLYYLINDCIESVVETLKILCVQASVFNAIHDSAQAPSGWLEQKELSSTMLWHLRLGHVPLKKLTLMGFNTKPAGTSNPLAICVTCPLGKLTKLPFSHSQSHACSPFELIHIEIWGPYKVQTRGGHRFFLTVVDDHTRTTWVTLLQHKSQAFETLLTFVKLAQTQFNSTVKVIRSNNALEFQDVECQKLYNTLGIVHQTSCVDTAQQNGRVERKHRNILEMARCLRF